MTISTLFVCFFLFGFFLFSQKHPRLGDVSQLRAGQRQAGGCVCGAPLELVQGNKRSNVKCMYCNKHVKLKRALVISLEC